MSLYSSIASVEVQNSNAIIPRRMAPYLTTFPQSSSFLQVALGMDDYIKGVQSVKSKDPSRWDAAMNAKGLKRFDILNIKRPSRALELNEMEAKVIRHNSIPTKYTFTAVDATLSATTGTWDFVADGEVMPVNGTLTGRLSTGVIFSVLITNVAPTGDGGARITYKNLNSSITGTIDNTPTAQKVILYGPFTNENGIPRTQKWIAPTVETFGMSKIGVPMNVSSESKVVKYDTDDGMIVAAAYTLSHADYIARLLTNFYLFSQEALNVQDADGQTIDIRPGIFNQSGIDTTDADLIGIGPTVMEAITRGIATVRCDASAFEMRKGVPVFDSFCGFTVMKFLDLMLRTSVGGTNNQVFVEHGDTVFNIHLKEFFGINAILRLHYDYHFDDSPYDDRLLTLNKNTLNTLFLKDHFMRLKDNPSGTTDGTDSWGIANWTGLAAKIKSHIHVATNIDGAEDSV